MKKQDPELPNLDIGPATWDELTEEERGSALDFSRLVHERKQGDSLECSHPLGRGPKADEDGQEAWFTARIASLIG